MSQDLEDQRAREERDNPISHSRKAWGFVLGGMFFVALINVIIGLWSFPFDAQERDRRMQREEMQRNQALREKMQRTRMQRAGTPRDQTHTAPLGAGADAGTEATPTSTPR